MSDQKMNLSVNGQSQVPPGFRFHPTEEELLNYYLKKKVAYEKIDLDVIRDVDLNKLEPWDIQEKCKIGSTPQNDWYFFSHKDKKYPTGTRTNRATAAGFWKATGRDKIIYSNLRRIGMRKTLVFYRGRAPHGQKSDWIMHEYRLDDNTTTTTTNHHDYSTNVSNIAGDCGPEEGWVVCRVFKKKNYHKALDGPFMTSSSTSILSQNDNVLDQIFLHMGKSSNSHKQENHSTNTQLIIPNHFASTDNNFVHLPGLMDDHENPTINKSPVHDLLTEPGPVGDWVALDRLVASQLNGQSSSSNKQFDFNEPGDFCFSFDNNDDADEVQLVNMQHTNNFDRQNDQMLLSTTSDTDFWSFAVRSSSSTLSLSSSSSDPLCHLSV
ncbi:hypothetical protein RD792_009248 [Penstemon davidsonii]|uniref:NAC domain-containing protein n=1 Tax=Penstemon davidsonii TaxID=160366 RepID=A0ABR0DCW4_9LAMI|nr:hypothetical protein RD792_009248 [Penstemon davidsonii]